LDGAGEFRWGKDGLTLFQSKAATALIEPGWRGRSFLDGLERGKIKRWRGGRSGGFEGA
jgi:hypothetical protein